MWNNWWRGWRQEEREEVSKGKEKGLQMIIILYGFRIQSRIAT